MHHGPGDTICLLCGTNSPSPPSGPRTRALGLLIRESCRVSCLTRWRTTLLVPMQEMEQEQEQLPTRALARAALATPPSDTCSRTRPLPACSLGPRGPGGNLTWRQHRLGRAEYRAWFCQQLGIEPPYFDPSLSRDATLRNAPSPSPRRSIQMNHTLPTHINSLARTAGLARLARSLARSDRRRVLLFVLLFARTGEEYCSIARTGEEYCQEFEGKG